MREEHLSVFDTANKKGQPAYNVMRSMHDLLTKAIQGDKLRVTGKNGSKRMWLVAGNEAYPPIELFEGHELGVWGE